MQAKRRLPGKFVFPNETLKICEWPTLPTPLPLATVYLFSEGMRLHNTRVCSREESPVNLSKHRRGLELQRRRRQRQGNFQNISEIGPRS